VDHASQEYEGLSDHEVILKLETQVQGLMVNLDRTEKENEKMIEIINGDIGAGQSESYFFAKSEGGDILLSKAEYLKARRRAERHLDLRPTFKEWRRYLALMLKKRNV
jgi:hypothetical protein